jgi:hypothetical protein
MNMPVLEVLYLSKKLDNSENNKITKVSALNKCGWNSLKYLNLSKNRFKAGLNKIQIIDLLRLKVLDISTQKPKRRYPRSISDECIIII